MRKEEIEKIRNMSDLELEKYLKKITSRNIKKCSICDNKCKKSILIKNSETLQTKTICGICEDCYTKLLDYLKTFDVEWG